KVERAGAAGKGSWWTIKKEFLVVDGDDVIFTGLATRQKKVELPTKRPKLRTTCLKMRKNSASTKYEVPVNKFQYDLFMDSIFTEEREECDTGKQEVAELCSILQSIHSTSNIDRHT